MLAEHPPMHYLACTPQSFLCHLHCSLSWNGAVPPRAVASSLFASVRIPLILVIKDQQIPKKSVGFESLFHVVYLYVDGREHGLSVAQIIAFFN